MATALTDEWSEEKCLQLIREYRVRPVLWDQKDPFFFNKAMKPLAWKEISAIVNISADQCKHKMTILMSSFRREKAKIMHCLNLKDLTDPSYLYKSTWFAFKEMAFLLDKETERKRQFNNDSDEIDEDDGSAASIKLALLNHHIDTPGRAKRSKHLSSFKKQLTQKLAEKEQEATAITIQQPIPGPSQTLSERDEEIKSFTSFIGNKMKKYSDGTKNAVQQAICEIIFKADQNYYEKTCYDNYTIIDEVSDPLNKQIIEEDRTVIKLQNDSDSD